MTTPFSTTCLVFERSNRWTVAVRRMMAGRQSSVRRVVAWPMVGEHLTESPECVVFVELSPDELAVRLRRLAELIERHRQAAWIVVGTPDLAAWQWLVREIGVVDVVLAPSQLNRTRMIIERLVRRAAPRNSSIMQRVGRMLPWPEMAERFRVEKPVQRTASTGTA